MGAPCFSGRWLPGSPRDNTIKTPPPRREGSPVTRGLLYVAVDPPPGMAVRFDRWQETHAGARVSVPGITSIRRYDAIEGTPRYLVRYDLSDTEVTRSPAYLAMRENRTDEDQVILPLATTMDRRVYQELVATPPDDDPERSSRARFLLAVGTATADPDGVDRWYEEELVPAVSRIEGWVSTRRYVKTEGAGPEHLALHDLTSLAFLGPDYEAACATPRAQTVLASGSGGTRHVYRVIRAWKPVGEAGGG